MTNADYVRQQLADADIALMIGSFNGSRTQLINKAYNAWKKWAESVTANHGNIAGCPGYDNPSIWYWELWCYPGNIWKRMGRTISVSMQVWFSKQYKPEEWEGEEDDQ